MLLSLTRYVGILMFGAVGLWWVWHWYERRQPLIVLVKEGTLLSIAALPIAGWFIRNHMLVGKSVGRHLESGSDTFTEGLKAMGIEGLQVLLPSAHYDRLHDHAGPFSFMVYLVIVAAVLFMVWPHRREIVHQHWPPHPPRTPLLLFLLYYILLYTVVQPFMDFWPIDTRDITTVLCLTIPWSIGMAASSLPFRRATLLLAGYVALNLVFAFGPTVYKGMRNGPPEWFSLTPPRIESLADRNLPLDSPVFSAGFVSWLTVVPSRSADLVNYHPDVLEYVRSLPDDTVLLSNAPILLVPYAPGSVEDLADNYPQPGIPGKERIPAWLEHGSCSSRQSHTIAIVVFDWDQYAKDAPQIREQVETKCPGLPSTTFRHSTIYQLPAN